MLANDVLGAHLLTCHALSVDSLHLLHVLGSAEQLAQKTAVAVTNENSMVDGCYDGGVWQGAGCGLVVEGELSAQLLSRVRWPSLSWG